MANDANKVSACLEECRNHLTTELLPFWLDRRKDDENGGFITHFDKDGNDSGEDEKSMLAQARTVYSMASAHRAGYGDGRCAEYAGHGVDFLVDKMWDGEHGASSGLRIVPVTSPATRKSSMACLLLCTP